MDLLSNHQSMRASLQVAPLSIQKVTPAEQAISDEQSQTTATTDLYSQSQMTPPTTPNSSQDDLTAEASYPMPPVFHNFLRAFYPFHPSYAMTDSSVTLPLNEGDVILVHSIHTNGWADGTLLISGARGWLPTNYCESYDPEEMRNLLKALLNFWDLLRSTDVNDNEIFGNQEFMKGIIAGVRYLLERTHSLTREAAIILRHEGLRRGRKSLLAELSSLVKTAKRLQECQTDSLTTSDDVNNLVDEMILKAFRIVTKGVRFLDIFEEDRRMRLPTMSIMATVIEESLIPPTPPADQVRFETNSNPAATEDAASVAASTDVHSDVTQPSLLVDTSQAVVGRRLSSLLTPGSASSHRLSQGSLPSNNRHSASFSHRLSLSGYSPLSRSQNLVSERLSKTHDTLLSQLGSFIGRLHLQSESKTELVRAIRNSATSGGELLAVVDMICAHDTLNREMLSSVRANLFARIQDLIEAGREIIQQAATEETDIVLPEQTFKLSTAATGCVKSAGECVERTSSTIARVGDFECEMDGQIATGIDISMLDCIPEERERAPSMSQSVTTSLADTTVSGSATIAESAATSEVPTSEPAEKPPPKLNILPLDKPLPEVPVTASSIGQDFLTQSGYSPAASRPSTADGDNVDSLVSSVSSLRQSLPPLPKLATTLLPTGDYTAEDQAIGVEFHPSPRYDSMTASSAGSTSTYMSRDSESSTISRTSTRATTPDHSLGPRSQPSVSNLSITDSAHQAEEVDDVESKLLEKTFAHELMFNKEGQVTGGSLPALVERLTTHESTPDALFVSTFYLTFRLFCTPRELAESLIDRFDYVGETPHIAGPVRLRVYNVLKGWLESHWRDTTDREALAVIVPFADQKLGSVLPSAGRRLAELADRVSSEGSLVPRLVSSMGKTNTSIAQYVPADTPLPAPIISRSQLNALHGWRTAGTSPSILDFDPVELARQLTIKQMNIFCNIMPEELLASQWMKNGGADAPNVKAMSSLSTDLSNLVAETILHYSEVKKRAATIKQWIKIAHQCYELHNYDGLMAIICSLNSSTISRLQKTWDAVSPKRREMLRTLQALVEPSQNHKLLRGRLHDHVPPCLPFLGMYLTDLTFVDIGNAATKQLHALGHEGDEEAGGITVVNFDKHTRTAKIIGELQRFQIPYRLTEVPEMQEWMTAQINRVRLNDPGNVQVTYYRKSLLLEPREFASRANSDATSTLGSTATTQRGADLFAWMSRGGGQQNGSTPA
ncbi:hypothetical protein jhhlp_000815 [Lomentospora prolificans]|uniref:Uncharacterized protein n=1 Tax=Lomentospora prolificans TaxID=41688 RepID=A0A2N3NJH9_9PEZI|nr:hypothetical protein jhhlp_000815 [Lomentospora prolificans]